MILRLLTNAYLSNTREEILLSNLKQNLILTIGYLMQCPNSCYVQLPREKKPYREMLRTKCKIYVRQGRTQCAYAGELEGLQFRKEDEFTLTISRTLYTHVYKYLHAK